jgi:hypothetical protein
MRTTALRPIEEKKQMTFQLDHEKARQLAKALTIRTGREVKLKDIYDDMGSIFGVRGDGLMHALKHMTPPQALPSKCTLSGKDTFIEEFLAQVNDIDYGYDRVAVAIVHLSSGDNVGSGGNIAEHKAHTEAFKAAVAPGKIDDMLVGDLGDNFFVFGWPKVYPAIHMSMFIENRFALIEKTLNDKVAAGHLAHPFEFAGAAWMAERTRDITPRNIGNWLARCEEVATKQVLARRQLTALPRIRFLSGD